MQLINSRSSSLTSHFINNKTTTYTMSPATQEKEVELPTSHPPPPPSSSSTSLLLLILNATLLILGTGGPLLLRVYFLHGGARMWFSSLIQICGWPLLLIPIYLSSLHQSRRRRLFSLPPSVFAASAFLGLLFGLDSYLYAYGSSYLPVSTSSILISTQLSFTAVFAFLIVRQRFTPYSINAVILLTIGPVVLGLSSSKDRPEGESNYKYYLGFFMTVAASALIGLVLPLMEWTYKMVKEGLGYAVVMEVQFLIGVFGTAFCLVGMVANKDFQAIPREAREFGLGEVKYYMVLVFDAIFWQLINLGLFGVICCSSSLFGGILIAVLLPIQEILAIVFFHEKFDGGKGVALALCLWGFMSYLYGERKRSKKLKKAREMEVALPMP